MAEKPKKDNDWVAWALIVFLFAVGLSPLALLLLFVKLFKGDSKKKELPEKKTREPARVEAGQTSRAREAVSKVTRSPAVKKSNARKLEVAGAVIFALGLMSATGYDPVRLRGGLDRRPGAGAVCCRCRRSTVWRRYLHG